MRNLLNFLIKYSTWFVFTFYVLISCVLLVNSSKNHHSLFMTSANVVGGVVYGTVSEVYEYFGLRAVNERLQESNANLQNEVLNLRNVIAQYKILLQDTTPEWSATRFNYIGASVINNSTRHPRNYFTINRGSAEGVKPGMGIIDQSGIVGIVDVTGRHTARAISLLNQNQHFSAKIKGTPYIGSLTWKGDDPSITYLEEVPRHAKYQIGDTIVTSGFSTTFPEGIDVGTIIGRIKTNDDTFYVLKVRLSSNFKSLGTVRIIKDELKHELDSIQSFDQ